MSRPDKHRGVAHIDPAIQSRIGRRLRGLYRGFASEPVPLEQIELLLALRRAERERRRELSETENTRTQHGH